MTPVEPGTYIIISVASGIVMTVPGGNGWDVVCWHKHGEMNQQVGMLFFSESNPMQTLWKWFVQQSGEGYRIKNCEKGDYLTISSMADEVAKVYCGRYPKTWELNQGHEDHNMHMYVCCIMRTSFVTE
jgi:hypothetical protein